MNIRSRILEFLPKDLIVELNSICRDVTIPDNNTKVNRMVAALDKYDVDYSELGPGTNRFAILIDGYVFKIAMDKAGIRDNLAEFSLSQELQPFVIKVYECNGLIITTEYVTVISKEEFNNSKEEIRHILSYLSEGYLLGDVGSINKNYMNWGYRDDGSLIILDFAYIYRVLGEEMLCNGVNKDGTICEAILEYDENFDKLICPNCRKKYTFHDIRRRISKEYESKELETIKQIAIKVDKPIQEVANNAIEINSNTNTNNGGIMTMGTNYNNEHEDIDVNDLYLAAMAKMKESYNSTVNDSETKDSCETFDTPDLSTVESYYPKIIIDKDVADRVSNLNINDDTEANCIEDDNNDTETESSDYEEEFISDPEDDAIIETEETEDKEASEETNVNYIQGYSKETVTVERTTVVSGITVFNADEPIVDDIVIDEESSEDKEPETIFIGEHPESKTDVDALRQELMAGLENDYDEYEEMYDETINENINRKYSSKQKRPLE